MKKIIGGSVLALVVLINSGCPRPCIDAHYAFSIQSQFTPDKDSINIGDTIFLTSATPIKMKDTNSGSEINYSNAKNFGSNLYVVKLLSNSTAINDAVFDFDYFSIKGRVYNDTSIPSPNRVQQLSYQESNSSYEVKIGIIPRNKGIYFLSVGNGLSTGRSKNRNCEKAEINITLNNTNQHFYFYSNWNPNGQLTEYEKPRAFFFMVR